MQPMDEIYQQYARMVYRYLLRLTGDDNLSEELTQETFYQAIRTSDRFDGSCAVSTWLCAIAKKVLATYRRKHPALENIDEQILAAPSAEHEALDQDAKTALLRRVHCLPEPGREVLYLRLYGGLSFREIGDIFGKTENWARVTFYRTKEKLRKDVEDDV